MATALDKPITDLRKLGESLQQAIMLTRSRLPGIKNVRLKIQVQRTLDRAEYMFKVMSQVVQTVDGLTSFLNSAFGIDIKQMLTNTRQTEPWIHGSTYSSMLLANEGIHRVLLELSEVNNKMDREVKQNGH